MAKLLGIDVGTSGARALLIDETGRVLKQASAEYPLSIPQSGWSEQHPEDWWNGVQACLAEIGEKAPDAIGLTGQMHGAVFLDKEDQVIRPAILWNDQRTEHECREIEKAVGSELVREITCNPPLTGFQAPKILWLRNNELSNYLRIQSVLLPKDYIRLRLTGSKRTEVSDASGTGLFHVPFREWSHEMLDNLELDAGWFPKSAESFEVSSETNGPGGLDSGVPVVGGGGDQAAAAVGTGAVVPDIVSVSLGTSGVAFASLTSDSYDPEGRTHTFCHANGGWHAMGVMLSCGGALKWFRDAIGHGRSYDAIAEIARTAPSGCEGLTFLPYLSGERAPYNDPAARGSFTGLSLRHGMPHMARSVFEGVSFGLLDSLELLRTMGASAQKVRVTGGGAQSDFWLQMLADVFRTPCATLTHDEGPAFGAAILAGVGIGVWPNVAKACAVVVKEAMVVEPSGIDYSDAIERYRALYPALRSWYRP